MTNLIIRPIAPMQNATLGGAQFYGADRLLYSVRADPDSHSEAPVELHVAGHVSSVSCWICPLRTPRR